MEQPDNKFMMVYGFNVVGLSLPFEKRPYCPKLEARLGHLWASRPGGAVGWAGSKPGWSIMLFLVVTDKVFEQPYIGPSRDSRNRLVRYNLPLSAHGVFRSPDPSRAFLELAIQGVAALFAEQFGIDTAELLRVRDELVAEFFGPPPGASLSEA
jgi:hypothetical protein